MKEIETRVKFKGIFSHFLNSKDWNVHLLGARITTSKNILKIILYVLNELQKRGKGIFIPLSHDDFVDHII